MRNEKNEIFRLGRSNLLVSPSSHLKEKQDYTVLGEVGAKPLTFISRHINKAGLEDKNLHMFLSNNSRDHVESEREISKAVRRNERH